MDDLILDQGREAAAQGNWRQAYELLSKADAARPLAGPDLALLADMAYSAGNLVVTIDAWERSHAEAMLAKDCVAAAGAAIKVALHLLVDTALMAPVRGWAMRAERLLENQGETPVHAWLGVVRSYERLLSGDFAGAREWARQAITVGGRCDPAAAALGRVANARTSILAGDVRQGLELLEEAAVATVSGELNALGTGMVYCEVVCAFQAIAQYDLAEEWTQAMEQWRHGHGVGSIHGRCRVHRAEILRLRGANDDAEKEALLACAELRPYLKREYGWPLAELGRIRLQTGNLDGAEQAFVAAREAGWDPQPGLALVQLARGDVAGAAASIRDSLENPVQIPSKELPPNSELRRAPLLEAQVEIAIAAGDLERARSAVDGLVRVAGTYGSKPMTASAALARGRLRLAEGNAPAARGEFETAMTLWDEVGAPFETALARAGLAEAYKVSGNKERALAELRAAQSVFHRIGAKLRAKFTAEACDELELAGVARVSPSCCASLIDSPPRAARRPFCVAQAPAKTKGPAEARGPAKGFTREGEYWSVDFDGAALRLRDGKGLRYLARLLAAPYREFHVLELIADESGWPQAARELANPDRGYALLGDAGELLDARAKDAYRRRLGEIDADIGEAESNGDLQRSAQAAREREILVRELSRAVGLGGRDRRAGSASERARVSVTRALRSSLVRMRRHSPSLGEHLDRSIRTGTHCAYVPDPRSAVTWNVSA